MSTVLLLTFVMRLRQVNVFTARARVGQRLNSTLCEKQSVRPQTVGQQSRAAVLQTSRQFNIPSPWSVRALPHVRRTATLYPVHFEPMEFVPFCRDVTTLQHELHFRLEFGTVYTTALQSLVTWKLLRSFLLRTVSLMREFSVHHMVLSAESPSNIEGHQHETRKNTKEQHK